MPNELEKHIRLLGEGDEKAFEKVYYAYISRVRSFLIKINLTQSLDDVVQDTFIILWKMLIYWATIRKTFTMNQ